MDAKPKWAAPAEPQSIAGAQKRSDLHMMFSRPVKVGVPTGKVTLQVRKMVIRLPLVTAGIWVRTGTMQISARLDLPWSDQINL
jgi:hypothetical protein